MEEEERLGRRREEKRKKRIYRKGDRTREESLRIEGVENCVG